MKIKIEQILFFILVVCGIYFFLNKNNTCKKRVRFNLNPIYYGIPARKPPNQPVRWGYR